MGAVIVLDSTVLLGLWDPDDVHHLAVVAAVRELRDAKARFVVPATVLTEVLVGAARQGDSRLRLRMDQIRAAFGAPHSIDIRTATIAARIRAEHAGIRTSDALVIASGQVAGAEEVLTTDREWEKVDPRVRVVE
jgi:predicted nucleic acid-binding protein